MSTTGTGTSVVAGLLDGAIYVGCAGIDLTLGGCSCRVLGSTGASAESVMVACGCTACAHRPPDELMADGGRVASLADWAAHAGLEAGSLNQLAVRQPGADCTVPFKSWLRAASEALGGEALLRKQCNVWWWDAEADGADDALPALPCRSAAAGGAQEKRYGLWRAATIVAYDPRTATHTLKYHTDPKKRVSYIYLPLAVLHWARTPPAPGTQPRIVPEAGHPLPPILLPHPGAEPAASSGHNGQDHHPVMTRAAYSTSFMQPLPSATAPPLQQPLGWPHLDASAVQLNGGSPTGLTANQLMTWHGASDTSSPADYRHHTAPIGLEGSLPSMSSMPCFARPYSFGYSDQSPNGNSPNPDAKTCFSSPGCSPPATRHSSATGGGLGSSLASAWDLANAVQLKQQQQQAPPFLPALPPAAVLGGGGSWPPGHSRSSSWAAPPAAPASAAALAGGPVPAVQVAAPAPLHPVLLMGPVGDPRVGAGQRVAMQSYTGAGGAMSYAQDLTTVLPGFGERDVDLLDAMLDELERQPWPLASRAGSSSCCSSNTGRDAMQLQQLQLQDLSLLPSKRVRLESLGTGTAPAPLVAVAAVGTAAAPNSAVALAMEPRAHVPHQASAHWHTSGPLSLKRMWEEEVFDDLREICDAAAAAAWD